MIGRFADLAAGLVIPTLEVEIDRADLIRYAGAADDYVRQHWDHPFMIASGYPDVVVHGWLTFAHMCRAATNQLPPTVATISDYAVRYLAPVHPGVLHCGGRVEEVYADTVRLSLSARDAEGRRLAAGHVTLSPASARSPDPGPLA